MLWLGKGMSKEISRAGGAPLVVEEVEEALRSRDMVRTTDILADQVVAAIVTPLGQTSTETQEIEGNRRGGARTLLR